MKKFLIVLTALLIIPTLCFADEKTDYNEYLNSFDMSAFESLDSSTKDFLEDLGINDFDYESISSISIEKVFKHIINVVLDKADGPVKSGLTVVCFIILTSFFKSMNTQLNKSELSSLFSTVSCLAISIFLVVKITDCIAMSCSTIKLCANFSFAFFPAFCIIVATSGGAVTSLSVNTTLLALAQGLNYIT